MDTDVRILEAQPHFTQVEARSPLKFGGVVLHQACFCHVRVTVENRRGQIAEGWGAILLAYVWGWPSARVPTDQREESMRRLVSVWCRRLSESDGFAHPVDLFWRLEPELEPLRRSICEEQGTAEMMPRLNALICASPADAAVHDAFGRAAGIDTYDGYGPEHMEGDLSAQLGPAFKRRFISDFLSPLPESVEAFHLVGGFDKLTESELSSEDPNDGLPVSLDQWIRYEGLHCLKVKLQGTDLAWDLQRLLDVVRVAREEHRRLGIEDLWISADTNEMCESPHYMVELLRNLKQQDSVAFRSVLYVEQPCERDLRRRRLDVRELASLKPVIIDEALTSLEDFDLALELGYSGVALKTCKCQSAELVIAAKASASAIPFAVQDLTNPGIALLHSVGLAGRLGTIRGVEANGRQFFPGASEPERTVHPQAYRLVCGRIGTSTIRGPGLGYQWERIGRSFG